MYPQHMFSSRNKKDISIFRMKKAPYLLLCMPEETFLHGVTHLVSNVWISHFRYISILVFVLGVGC